MHLNLLFMGKTKIQFSVTPAVPRIMRLVILWGKKSECDAHQCTKLGA